MDLVGVSAVRGVSSVVEGVSLMWSVCVGSVVGTVVSLTHCIVSLGEGVSAVRGVSSMIGGVSDVVSVCL